MRFLLRQLLSEPKLLFGGSAALALALAILAFVWSERRARRLAELSDDPIRARGQQRVRLAVVGTVAISVIAAAGWWSFGRVTTDPHRVMVAIAIETAEGPAQWWDGDPGALALSEQLAEQLEAVGFESIGFEAELLAELKEAGPEAPARAAREHDARWLIRGRVRVAKQIALEFTDSRDYLLDVELELVDSQSGEAMPIPHTDVRALLWGKDPSDAVLKNRDYLVDRLTMPLIATLGAHPALREYAGDTVGMTSDDALIATALRKLFLRADSYAEGLELRRSDEASATAREPANHAQGTHLRLSGILAEEYFVGTVADGRALLLATPKQISVIPDRLGYVISNEAEQLVLGEDGDTREVLFEHYNFYSAPAISADGRVVWTTVANHGESKTLATLEVSTGEFTPVLSHQTDYYTSPIPAPDGRRALFYSRPGRYAETSIELIARDGTGRKSMISNDLLGGVPAWSPDGRTIYAPIGAWQRIVAIDPDTGEVRHLLGQDPDAPVPEPEPAVDEPAAPPESSRELGLNFGHHGAPAAALGDPATTSRFTAISVGHDGSYLYVVEQSLDGRDWLGRLDLVALAAAPIEQVEPVEAGQPPQRVKPYVRLAQMEVGWIEASPTAAMVAFEAPSFTATGDPETQDREVLVFGPAPGQLRAVTLNAVDDELGGWSRDGRSVFSVQRSRDPGDDSIPVVRTYRHQLAQ